MIKALFLLVLMHTCSSMSSQSQSLAFEFTLGNQPLEIGVKTYSKSLKDSLQIDAFRFYISSVTLFNGKDSVHSLKQTHFLIDAEKKETTKLRFSTAKEFNRISFQIGVDSTTNSAGAHGGDLDPMNGMYWSWQSGYINLKLEGSSALCPTRKNEFQFHLGGYSYPNNSLTEVSLKMPKGKEKFILIPLDSFFKEIDLPSLYSVMSPGEDATQLLKIIGDSISSER